MTGYNWESIVKNYDNEELNRIYREKYKEPEIKVAAVVKEMQSRGLLKHKPENSIPKLESDFVAVDEVAGKTKSNLRRSDLVVLAIAVVCLLHVLSGISSYLQYDLLQRIVEGEFVSYEEANNSDTRVLVVSILTLGFYLISSIVFITWFYRAYLNLHKRMKNVEFSKGWAIGAWFVPIISFLRPFNIMVELNTKTDDLIDERGLSLSKKPDYITVWWIIFIVSVIAQRVAMELIESADSVSDYIFMTVFSIVSSLIVIVLGFFTIKMIRNFERKEELLFESEKDVIRTTVK